MAPDDQDRGRCRVTPLRPLATTGAAWAVTVCAEPATTGTDRPVPGAVGTSAADGGDVTYRLDSGLEHVELEVNLVLGEGMVWAIADPSPPQPLGEPAAPDQFFRHELQARTADGQGTGRPALRLRISAHRLSPPPPGAERAGHLDPQLPPSQPGQPPARPARELGIAGLATAS